MRTSVVAMATCLSVIALSGASEVQAAIRKHTNIPAQGLGPALQLLGKERNFQLVYVTEEIADVRTQGAVGELTPEEALTRLLEGTGLTYRYLDENTVTIAPGGGGTAAAGAQPEPRIEEVIVTAQRREENLQQVPVSITAIGETKLRALGASEFSEFARTVPGLTFNEFGHNNGSFTIRGVTSSISGGGLQATVATYIDDLPSLDTYAGLSTPDLHLFDVNRVEVLRGPQGTLFGSGAMGGALRIITNKPDTGQFVAATDMTASTTEGGEESYAVSAMTNIPLIDDKLAMRAVGYLRDNGGWVDNAMLGDNRNSERSRGGRLMFKYEPTQSLSLLGSVTYQNSEPEDGAAYTAIVDGRRVRNVESPEFVQDEFAVYNLTAEYDFAGMRLRSTTTYAKKEVVEQQDTTVNTRNILGPTTPASYLTWNESSDNFFQELHLFSTGQERLGWFAGAFYRDQDDRSYDFSWIVPGSEQIYGPGPVGAAGDDVFAYLQLSATSEQALFGELSYELLPRLKATVGVRYFENEYESVTTSQGLFNGGFTRQAISSDESKATYKYVLSYQFDDDAMLYAQASQGYRVGSANSPVPDPIPATFAPDSLWNYELGAKTTWLDRRLKLNGAVYYIDWTQMQLSQYTTNGWFYITNVGNTRSVGAELEIEAELGERLRYSGATAWNSAEIRVDNTAINARAGDRVPGVPHFTISNQLEYALGLWGDRDGYVRLSHQYLGGAYSGFNQTTSAPLGDYHVVGLRVGGMLGSVELSVFVNNLLDEDAVATALGATQVYLLRPRTYGINARVNF